MNLGVAFTSTIIISSFIIGIVPVAQSAIMGLCLLVNALCPVAKLQHRIVDSYTIIVVYCRV
jgi:hypothetical protein